MKENNKTFRNLVVLFGFLAVTLFVFNFIVLLKLKPRMINFEGITGFENGLLTAVGFGLVTILIFYLLSLWRFIRDIRNSEQIKPLSLFLVISGVLALIFIFSDVALLSDIHKQYRNGLSQPEWSLVLPILVIQFVFTIIFLYVHIKDRSRINQDAFAVRDINVFLIVQYIGVISGLMGLGLASLGFVYSSGWNVTTHSLMGGIVLLFPYAMAIFYWLITKFQEKDRQWFDEKQRIDIGRSALVTLSINSILMLILFVLNLNDLDGIVSRIWLPIYLFASILIFSIGNLYYSSKA